MAFRIGRRVFIAIAAGSLLLSSTFGQGRGGSTGGGAAPPSGGSTGSTGTTGTTPTIGTTGRTPTTPGNTPNSGNTLPTTVPQPIYISGRVLLEDGNPPPESVTIERVCSSGAPHAEGYTDSRGYFGITLGQALGVIQDASEIAPSPGGFGDTSRNGIPSQTNRGPGSLSGASSEMRFMNCDLQAKLGGYRSQIVSLANHRAMDNPDIGTILLHRLLPTEGTTVSASSLAAPKDAHKAFERGMEAAKKKKWDDAAKDFQKATDLYPGYAEAWYELGRLQANAAPDTAKISFEIAMKADPKYAPPYVQLAILDVQAKKWKEVASLTDRGLRLDSFDYPELFFFNAVANYYLRNSEVAEKNARQALKLDNQHRFPQSAYLLGLLLMQRRDYAAAAEQFQAYLKLSPDAEDAPTAKQKLEQIQQISAQGGEPRQDQ